MFLNTARKLFPRRRKLLFSALAAIFLYVIYSLFIPPNVLQKELPGPCNDVFDDCPRHYFVREQNSATDVNAPSLKGIERRPVNQSAVHSVVTKPVDAAIVVYNRVPKCASSTMKWLILVLKDINHFNVKIHNWPKVKQSLTTGEERELVQKLSSFTPPVLFLRHLHFVDFEKYNVKQPTYINFIRDPVDRFVSHYYFQRFGFVNWNEEKIKKWLTPMSEKRRNMSIDECVHDGAEKCVRENKENMMQFFCGQDVRCKKRDDWSLRRAMRNIEKHYTFIGVVEDLKGSIKVLEAILPRYFRNGSKFFKLMVNGGQKTKTAHKVDPTERTRHLLEAEFSRELKLYDFVRTRLRFQQMELEKNGKITGLELDWNIPIAGSNTM